MAGHRREELAERLPQSQCAGRPTQPPTTDSTASTIERDRHGRRRLVHVVRVVVVGAAARRRRSRKQQPEHVEGGQAGGDDGRSASSGCVWPPANARHEDLVLEKKPASRRDAGDRERADQERSRT